MYITITAQKMSGNYSKSSADFVGYLEKENQGLEQQDLPAEQAGMEHFFNQYGDEISAEEVVREIDGNTAKLEKHEPRFYSITVSPSKYELKRLQNHSEDLKKYTREIMKDYVASFNREINGRPITIDDIKYYAKIEHQRTFKGTDFQIKENQSLRATILFERYPDLERAYKLCQNLSWIFNHTKDKTSALVRLAKWDEKVRQAEFSSFNTIARTMSIHYKNILNYFDNRSTNASAESFNAKIKAFRAQFRGVKNVDFFLFRLSTIFA